MKMFRRTAGLILVLSFLLATSAFAATRASEQIRSYSISVRVIDYTSTGGFAGGYDKNGDFTWIIDEPPSAFNHSYSQIADKTIYNYNVDVLMNNCCTLYYPDGI